MTTLACIDQKIELLKKQRTRLASQSAQAERSKRTRQAVVIGALVMAQMPEVFARIKGGLTRPQDLELFGLDPLKEFCKPSLEQATFSSALDRTG